MRKVFLSLATAAMLVLSFGFSQASQDKPAANGQNDSSQQYQVKIDNFSFGPATLTIPVGATVTWINQDDVPHTIVSSEGKTLNLDNSRFWRQEKPPVL